jgi:hypothetical protein
MARCEAPLRLYLPSYALDGGTKGANTMTEEQTYAQGIQDGVRRAFDFLQSTAANTDDLEKCRILTDVAEDVLEFAPEFKTTWLEMEAYRKVVVAGYVADTKNAARYRFLRHGDNDENVVKIIRGKGMRDKPFLLRNEILDAAIDAGIAAVKEMK